MNTWNRERKRTRDRLLQYDFSIMPVMPHSAGLPVVYPWEDSFFTLSILQSQLYKLAVAKGYLGTQQMFWNRFSQGMVITGTIDTFPVPGVQNNLYLDTETDILYYFKTTTSIVDSDLLARIDAAIVDQSIIEGTQEVITSLYIPVRAMLIQDIILNCGHAPD